MDECLVHSKFADHLQDLSNLFESLIKMVLKYSLISVNFSGHIWSTWDSEFLFMEADHHSLQ